MQDAVGAAPFRQQRHERSGCERLLAMRGRQQRNSCALTRGCFQNVKAAARKARLDRHGADFAALRRQMPSAAALFFLVQDGKIGEVTERPSSPAGSD